MSSFKEQWFRQMERDLAEKLDKGIPEDRAYQEASDEAYEKTMDAMLEKADMERRRRREEGK
jgi:hypothetical protein